MKIHARKRKNKKRSDFVHYQLDKAPPTTPSNVFCSKRSIRADQAISLHVDSRGVIYKHSTGIFEQGPINVNLMSI